MTALAVSHCMNIWLCFYQQACFLQVGQHLLAGFVAVQPRITPGSLRHCAVLGNHNRRRQVMTLADGKIIGIMGRRNFHSAAAEFRVNVIIGNNGNLPVHQGQYNGFAD